MKTEFYRFLQVAFKASVICCFLGIYLSVSLLEIGVGLTLLLGFIGMCQTSKFQFILNHPLFPSVLSLAVAIVLSVVFAEPYPFGKPLEKVGYLLAIFPFTFFFWKFPQTRTQIVRLCLVLSFVLGITATLQFFGCFKNLKFLSAHSMPIPGTEGRYFLATGFTFHHTPFGASVIWIFHVLLAQLLIFKKKKEVPWLVAGAGFCLLAIVLSFSRGVWLSLFCSGLFVMTLINWKRAAQLLLLSVFLVGILFASSSPFRDRLSSFRISANQERLDLWKISIDMFKDSPVFGQGFHSFGNRIDQFSDRRLSDPHFPVDSHNMYLDFLSSTGIVGFAAFLIFLFSIGKSLFKGWKETAGNLIEKSWLLTATGGFLSFLIAGFFDRHFYMVQTLIPTLFFLGIAISGTLINPLVPDRTL